MTNTPPPLPTQKKKKSYKKIIWIAPILVIILIGCILKTLSSNIQNSSFELEPGRAEFNEANKIISSTSKGLHHGNTPLAEQLAQTLNGNISNLRSALFTQDKRLSKTFGPSDFITYCHIKDDSCVFIIRTPKLKKFSRDAKEQLCKLAWISANQTLAKSNIDQELKLAVGLRGFVSYATIYTGSYIPDAKDPFSTVTEHKGGVSGYKHFYSYFAPENEEVLLISPHDDSSVETKEGI
jgi:hypothetical protein